MAHWVSTHTKEQRVLVTSHANYNLERERAFFRQKGYLPSMPRQKFLMEHSNSRWKLLNTFWPRRVLIMTLRFILVFHMQLLPQPWDSLGESGYIFNIVSQMPHSWLKDGTVYPHWARRDTLDKVHQNEPLITDYHAPKLMLLHGSSVNSRLYFTLKQEHCIPESLSSV